MKDHQTVMRMRVGAVASAAMMIILALVPLRATAAPLPAPVPVSPAASSIVDQPLFQWNPVDLADHYEIEVALDAMPCQLSDNEGGLVCPLPDRMAIQDSAYVGRFAKRSAPVTNLDALPTDDGHNVYLSWGDALTAAFPGTPGGVDKYQMQISAGDWSAASIHVTDNTAISSAVFQNRLSAGTYRWRVRAFDGQGVALTWAQGPECTIQGAPDPEITPTPSPMTSGNASASPNPSQTGFPSESATPTPTVTYDLRPGANDGAAAAAPGKPGKPVVRRSSKNGVRVSWRAAAAYADPVTGYMVYRSTDSQRFTRVATTERKAQRVTLKRGKTYWFYVVAQSAAGRSPNSATTKFRMPRR